MILGWLLEMQHPDNSKRKHEPIKGLDLIRPSCGAAALAEVMVASDGELGFDRNVQAAIVLGITTCMRLSHFLDTMTSLEAAVGPLPNSLISSVMVVDDGSSDEDRAVMLSTFPGYTFIFKSSDQRGHAHSMNILVSEFLAYSSRAKRPCYFMYLEDDWRVLGTPVLHASLARAMRGYDNRADETDPAKHPFSRLLEMSKAILSSGDSGSAGARDRVHQVLFNEQGSRTCALGDLEACDTSIIGSGGWPQTKMVQLSTVNGSTVDIPYSLHEFGMLTSSDRLSDGRVHEFSNWPGLSLNPGLWDLRTVYRAVASCRGSSHMFDTDDTLFEQRFAVTGFAAGLTMAYLPALLFEHTGDVSAYSLNDRHRPWD